MTVIRRGSPLFDDDWNDRRSGWRFECSACGWASPVMKHRLGSERHAGEHVCEPIPATARAKPKRGPVASEK